MRLRTCHKATIAKDNIFNSSTGVNRSTASTRRFSGRGQMVSATGVFFTSLLFSLGGFFIRPSGAIGFGFETSQSDTVPSCASVDVRGLEYCPQMIDVLPTLMENKRALLRLASDALAGTTSIVMTRLDVHSDHRAQLYHIPCMKRRRLFLRNESW